MSKELQAELDAILVDVREPLSRKKNVTFSLDAQLHETFRQMLGDKRKMSRTIEALIREFVRTRQTNVVDISQAPKKIGA